MCIITSAGRSSDTDNNRSRNEQQTAHRPPRSTSHPSRSKPTADEIRQMLRGKRTKVDVWSVGQSSENEAAVEQTQDGEPGRLSRHTAPGLHERILPCLPSRDAAAFAPTGNAAPTEQEAVTHAGLTPDRMQSHNGPVRCVGLF